MSGLEQGLKKSLGFRISGLEQCQKIEQRIENKLETPKTTSELV
jgi:hypothetical protein